MEPTLKGQGFEISSCLDHYTLNESKPAFIVISEDIQISSLKIPLPYQHSIILKKNVFFKFKWMIYDIDILGEGQGG